MSEKIPYFVGKYRQYRILMKAWKKSTNTPLLVSDDEKGHSMDAGVSALIHPAAFLKNKLTFEVRVKNNDLGHYEIKLHWRELKGPPVFRFESRGGGHFNEGADAPLPKRKIPNPHFHRVGRNGSIWAFRTDLLEDPEQEKLISSNYLVGVKHFCQEANIHGPDGEDLLVEMVSARLPLSATSDPLEGVTY